MTKRPPGPKTKGPFACQWLTGAASLRSGALGAHTRGSSGRSRCAHYDTRARNR
jgi:hypothetical protein